MPIPTFAVYRRGAGAVGSALVRKAMRYPGTHAYWVTRNSLAISKGPKAAPIKPSKALIYTAANFR